MKEKKTRLINYSDVNWCGVESDKRSTSYYSFMYNEAVILWCTKKQPVTIFSSCKVEYIVESFFMSSNLVGFIAEETKI